MRNIIICIPSLEYGGAERVTTRLANYFSKQNTVTVITVRESKQEYKLNCSINKIVLKSSNSFSRVFKLRSVIKKINPDIVITMFAPMYILVYYAMIGLNIPQIVSERNDPRNYSGSFITRLLYQKILTKADGIVFQTKQAQSYYKQNKIKSSTIIYNPIDHNELPAYFLGTRNKVIVNVGRLHEQKNQKLLIDAMINIHKKIPEYKLIIYGEGNLRNALSNYIEKGGASEYIELAGQSNNVLTLINKASLFVLSSNFEGMPNALIEAMCLGLPVISTNCPCGGPSELIRNNENGILVDVNNEEQLSNAILEVINNPTLCKRISTNALQKRKQLDINTIGLQWLNYCDIVLQGEQR